MENNFGRFDITLDYINDDGVRQRLYKLFSQMIVVRAECDYAEQAIKYIALSPLFEETDRTMEIPYYDVSIEEGEVICEKVRME